VAKESQINALESGSLDRIANDQKNCLKRFINGKTFRGHLIKDTIASQLI
jgi:hypothetical protein